MWSTIKVLDRKDSPEPLQGGRDREIESTEFINCDVETQEIFLAKDLVKDLLSSNY
jgi:hypothetical protein